MLDVDEDVQGEVDEDADDEGLYVGALDMIGIEAVVVIMSEDVWTVSPDTNTMLRQGLGKVQNGDKFDMFRQLLSS